MLALMARPKPTWFSYFASLKDPGLPVPPEPTEHLAGEPEKIAVIQWRISNGYQPYHPLDARGRYVTTATDHKCITIVGDVFKVETHRTVEGKRVRFRKTFAILNDALDWLDWLNEMYPVQRGKSD